MSIFDVTQRAPTQSEIQSYAAHKISGYKGYFVHVPKSAGSSINAWIESNMIDSVLTAGKGELRDLMNDTLNMRPVYGFELSMAEAVQQIVGTSEYDRLYSFAIVRNPWDRYVSNWKFLTREHPAQVDRWKEWGLSGSAGKVSFENFIQQTETLHTTNRTFHANMSFGSPGGYDPIRWHISDQVKHILDSSGNLLVDFVGRFETLQSDFEKICKQLGAPAPTLDTLKQSWDSHVHYSHYYTPALYETIKKRCSADIAYFGYDFDDQAGILGGLDIPCTGDLCAQFGYPDWTGPIENPVTTSEFLTSSNSLLSKEYPEWTGTIQNPATTSPFVSNISAHMLNHFGHLADKNWTGTIPNPVTTSAFGEKSTSHSMASNFNADGKLGW